jgi:hypothetical protein
MDELDFVSWKIVQWVLWAGPLGIAAFLATIAAGSFVAGYFFDPAAFGLKRPKAGRPMQAQKMDHIKYDILPDGTLGPGDNRNLEGPE